MIDLFAARTPGRYIKPISTVRSTAEQQDLYRIGRTEPGKIRTNADGISVLSNHQAQEKHGEFACHACDLGIFDSDTGEYITNEGAYLTFRGLAEECGLYSGWRFPEQNPDYKVDPDHVECQEGEL
jgi:hypothetical protein